MEQMRKEVRLRENIRRHAHGDEAKEARQLARYGLTTQKGRPMPMGSREERKKAQKQKEATEEQV
jgi:hypothetical protein